MRGATGSTGSGGINRNAFQLTRPMRGATFCYIRRGKKRNANFNSHAPCGAQRDNAYTHRTADRCISTHTPHAGRNAKYRSLFFTCCSISTHTPHAGRNIIGYQDNGKPKRISTHTPHAGRNIQKKKGNTSDLANFNSHAPCGAQPSL